jgi:hypothetical protein
VGLFSSIFRRTPRTPALWTGRVLTAQQVGDFVGFPVILKDATYAEVSSAWLRSFYDDFRAVLFREGVTKWEETFDCDDFAAFYVSLANVRYFNATWSSSRPAQGLALGEYWFRPDGKRGEGHAVVTALTERGQIYIEPQSGQELTLSQNEKLSRYVVKL